jgi:GntR family transcriptional regulator
MNDEELIQALRQNGTDTESIAEHLQQRLARLIDGGKLEHGRRLPVERKLADDLGVSRIVVRRAMDSLQRRGMVERRQGSGTYVTSARIEGNLRLLSGFSEELNSSQHHMRTRIVQFGFCAPEPAVQEALEIQGEALDAVRLIRVRYVDDLPSTYEVSWMPAAIAQHLIGQDLTNESLFRLLAENPGVIPDHATERLRSTVLETYEAKQLECEAGDPAFQVNRTTYDANGNPIEYVETLLRGDRYYYSTTLEAPHRLPDASERLSRFETLATEPR